MSTSTTSSSPKAGGGLLERATELRAIIAILFGVYGIVCLILSAFTTEQELQKAAGINVNLWSGIGMLVVSALFLLWAVLKPLGVEDAAGGDAAEDDRERTGSQ